MNEASIHRLTYALTHLVKPSELKTILFVKIENMNFQTFLC